MRSKCAFARVELWSHEENEFFVKIMDQVCLGALCLKKMKWKYLNFILSSTTRFSISIHIILSRRNLKKENQYNRSSSLGSASLTQLTFSNMASYFTYANQLVLIQRWAKSKASSWASADWILDKPEGDYYHLSSSSTLGWDFVVS